MGSDDLAMAREVISKRKEVTTMTYNKPEVEVLGKAGQVIQSPKINPGKDSPDNLQTAAYELDEE